MRWLAGLALVACAGCTGPGQDVDFLRGCWTMRDRVGGEVEMRLNFLPERETLHGVVQDVQDGAAKPTVELWFRRDGRSMELTNHDPNAMVNAYKLDKRPVKEIASTPPPALVRDMSAEKWAAFSEEGLKPEIAGWIVASRYQDDMSIFVVHGDGDMGQTIFTGHSEPCS